MDQSNEPTMRKNGKGKENRNGRRRKKKKEIHIPKQEKEGGGDPTMHYIRERKGKEEM